ncbi:MAG TPA: universal stress protein [Solirubrobacteraceae bacterium]|nr:universal stress protein [Solirubrobacteraceae bacterium]
MTNTPTADSHSGNLRGDAAPVFSNILCAVDGTRTSLAAVAMAASLAGRGGRLTLLSVTGERGSGQFAAAAINPERAKAVLSYAKQLAEEAGVHAATVLDPGRPPVDVILEHAREHDLLVLGGPPVSRVAGLLVGGVAVEALSQLTTPTLIVRRSFGGSLRGRRVVVASDGLEGSERIVRLAGALARSQGAQVTLVHASGSEARVAGRSIESQGRELATIVPDACEVVTEPGGAAEVILQAAAHEQAELVVLGTRRLAGVRALGSVSRRIVHEAECPVLLVPPEQ